MPVLDGSSACLCGRSGQDVQSGWCTNSDHLHGSNSNCVHALDCLFGGGCTSALLVLGGVHVDADGGCGLVRGAGQNLHSKFQEEISDFVHSVELWYVPTC